MLFYLEPQCRGVHGKNALCTWTQYQVRVTFRDLFCYSLLTSKGKHSWTQAHLQSSFINLQPPFANLFEEVPLRLLYTHSGLFVLHYVFLCAAEIQELAWVPWLECEPSIHAARVQSPLHVHAEWSQETLL
ncbi:hypothetical protein KP509_19G024000 [Ceratopteris richardii]|uniref:Uncharacterized protein n=1 Tax=Ceratopteris richardii TaxID=49495 RepID=A0A8T2SJH1_CERRI|nr:hypothetical protein KP509_19G024000 [Ceratopteris richardii]